MSKKKKKNVSAITSLKIDCLKIEIHTLTTHTAWAPNRGELGELKTMHFAGTARSRVSSQSIKHFIRNSDVFREALVGRALRTRCFGEQHIYNPLVEGGYDQAIALEVAEVVTDQLRAPDKRKSGAGEQKRLKKMDHADRLKILDADMLVFFGPNELAAAAALVASLLAAREPRVPSLEDALVLQERPSSPAIALFGRMIAAHPRFNVPGALQCSHAMSINPNTGEVDFYTASDDLSQNGGSGFMGEAEFSSGIFYHYSCIDRALLKKNLNGDEALTRIVIRAYLEALVTLTSPGKKNSFSSPNFAFYVRVEKSLGQPRSLCDAFVRPIDGPEMVAESIVAIEETAGAFDAVYDTTPRRTLYKMVIPTREGRLSELLEFASLPAVNGEEEEE